MTTTRVLKTRAEYEDALREVRRLAALDPALGTGEADALEVLTLLVSDYEAKNFPIGLPDPVDAIRFRMEQMGLAQRDLVPYIGSKSKVSEVLARKRPLSLHMVRALSTGLGIPARVLVQEPPKPDILDAEWRRFPIREMAARGYFETAPKGRELKASAETLLADFLAPVRSRPVYAFRKQSQHVRTKHTSLDNYALHAWTVRVIRQALAHKPKTAYRPDVIDAEFLQQVARLSWSSQGPMLAKEFLEHHGISVVVERHFPKTYLDGAALWADKDHPVIGMTLRYDRLDNFWFCLMHEIAHLHLHLQDADAVYYDDLAELKNVDHREAEADATAREALVPRIAWEASAVRYVRSPDAVKELAKQLHVHPAVVAGRVRFESDDYTVLSSMLGSGIVQQLFTEYTGRTGEKD